MSNEISIKKPLTIHRLVNDDEFIKKAEKQLGDSTQQFLASVITLVNSNSLIKSLDPIELYNTCLMAASIKLPFNQNLGQAYIVPYKDGGKTYHPQLQIGWKGFVQLAQRSNQFKTINVSDVRAGEIKSIDRLTGEMAFEWISDDDERDKAEIVGYVGYFELTNGFRKSIYMRVPELKKHADKYSKSYKTGKGLWVNDFDAMARKTVIKLLLSRYAPLSIEMARAIEIDQSNQDGKYPDNPKNDKREIKIEPIDAEAVDAGR